MESLKSAKYDERGMIYNISTCNLNKSLSAFDLIAIIDHISQFTECNVTYTN